MYRGKIDFLDSSGLTRSVATLDPAFCIRLSVTAAKQSQAQSAKPSACHNPPEPIASTHAQMGPRIAHLLVGVLITSMELATEILRT